MEKLYPCRLLFACKASKFITHWKRLNPDTCENSIDLMVTRLKVLGPKVGPVLFQLPAHFEADRERLVRFLKMLPDRYRYAFEFRHRSWYEDTILDVLRDHDASLCLSDHQPARGVPCREAAARGTARSTAMDRNKMRTRLRDINIKRSRLLRDKSAADRFVQMAALRTERGILLGLLSGGPALRLVSDQASLPVAHRQSA